MMKKASKNDYKPPTLEVIPVNTESNIAESGRYSVELEDWKTDDTPPAPYDGDVWLNL
jgi:hypothetical protein